MAAEREGGQDRFRRPLSPPICGCGILETLEYGVRYVGCTIQSPLRWPPLTRSPVFRAFVRVGSLDVPVRFYSAARKEQVRFRLLHDDDEQPLERRMICPNHDEAIPPEDRARGYEVARGEFVVLDPDSLDELRPDPDRRIDMQRFVELGEVDPRLLDRPYHLGPEENEEEPYALLVHALRERGKAAVCRWTMRRRFHNGLLQPRGDTLIMTTLRYRHELVDRDRFEIGKPDYSDKEFDSACELIDELTESFDPEDYQDDYQQRLMRFIEQKARGEKPKMKTPKRRKPTTPGRLQATLQKSLERARAD